MGARMSTETFWRHLQVKQLYSWIKSLPFRGEMVCLSHTLWSGCPLTRRMRALFHRTMGLYLLILPDLTHHLSLTGGKDSRVSLDVILCPSLQCFHHASLSICQWTDTHQMAGGRGYSCTICVRPLLWSHAYWGSQRVWWFWFRARIQHLTAERTKVPSEGDREPETKSKETAVRHPAVNPVC